MEQRDEKAAYTTEPRAAETVLHVRAQRALLLLLASAGTAGSVAIYVLMQGGNLRRLEAWLELRAELSLVAGLCTTAAAVLFVYSLTRRAAAIERLVIQRTDERDRFWRLSGDLLCIAGFDGYFKQLNPAWTRVLGYSREELLARPIAEMIHPDDVEATAARRAQMARDRQAIVAFENRYRCRDGTYRWLQWNAVPYMEEGLVYAVAHDVTDRKEQERKLAEAVRELRKLSIVASRTDNAVILTDARGRLEWVNDGFTRMTGYALDEVTGRTPGSFLRGALTDPAVSAEMTRCVGAGEGFSVEILNYTKSGRPFWNSIDAQPLRDTDGGLAGFMAIERDVTDRRKGEESLARQASELARSNADLEEFAYAASHDLRAPLRAIANLSQWLEEDLGPQLTPDTRKHLELLRGRTKRMEMLVDGLLTYSRAGRAPLTIQELDTRALVADVVLLLNPPPGFAVVALPSLPVFQTAKAPFEQVMQNLIGNAIKHHGGTGGRVEVWAEDAGDFHRFFVRDDGPGIAPEFHDRVFKMFQTLRPRDEVEGSGLGLTLVKKLVERYGGSVTLASAPGAGATFSFTWPKDISSTR